MKKLVSPDAHTLRGRSRSEFFGRESEAGVVFMGENNEYRFYPMFHN
ncbi:MAG: hypothetical protein ABFD51_02525 [Anaerolineaceae bacterium]